MTGTVVRSLLAGRSVPFGQGQDSAIAKSRLAGPVRVTRLGIESDEQADQVHHGGLDKALHHYPFDHYVRWEADCSNPLLADAGAFGENLSTLGLTEDDVCIGDRFRVGTVLVEVSQARKPCWKQGHRLDWSVLPKLMVQEGRSGWYYRVIEEGEIEAGDTLNLLDRPYPKWTARRTFDLIVAGKHKADQDGLRALANLDVLFDGWRKRALELLND